MTHSHAEDLLRIKELLQHTGEFIAYFELAETKMVEWREDIAYQGQKLQSELNTINNTLSAAGTEHFKSFSEQIVLQSKVNIQRMEDNCTKFIQKMNVNQEQLLGLTEQCIKKIEHYSQKMVHNIALQLSQYDVQQFHRIANESCDHVARTSHHAIAKSTKLLAMFQLRFGVFIIFLTLLTAGMVGLYLSDELPWEMHKRAQNERQAGKVLLHAWPNLTQEEKAKILSDTGLSNG